MAECVRNILNDPEALRRSEEDTIVSAEGGNVTTGNVCSACPALQADVALVKGRQEMVMKNQDDMKDSLGKIYDLLRATNGAVATESKSIAVVGTWTKVKAWTFGLLITGSYAWLYWQHTTLVDAVKTLAAHVGKSSTP